MTWAGNWPNDATPTPAATTPWPRGARSPPQLAVVECDGGRIRTREPGNGPGVHRTGEGWRETKNACLIRALRTVSADDPQPEPPACFGDPQHVAQIAETQALSVAAVVPEDPAPVAAHDAPAEPPPPPATWRPETAGPHRAGQPG